MNAVSPGNIVTDSLMSLYGEDGAKEIAISFAPSSPYKDIKLSVTILPGLTAFTVIPSLANSKEAAFIKAFIPPLLAE